MGRYEVHEPQQVRAAIRDVDSAIAAGAVPPRDAVLILRDVARDHLRTDLHEAVCPLEPDPGDDVTEPPGLTLERTPG